MRKLTAIGLILAAVVLLAGSSAAQKRDGCAQAGAKFWPCTTGDPVVQEWYADIPWHQKLGTYVGNEIDVPIVLPYDALQEKDKQHCGNPTDARQQAACMLELGINNVLGVYRTDTLYDPSDANIKKAAYCSKDPNQPCIEVKLELASFWTRSTDKDGNELEPSKWLQPRPFGFRPPFSSAAPHDYYGGYVITNGSTYAPPLPWYMS